MPHNARVVTRRESFFHRTPVASPFPHQSGLTLAERPLGAISGIGLHPIRCHSYWIMIMLDQHGYGKRLHAFVFFRSIRLMSGEWHRGHR